MSVWGSIDDGHRVGRADATATPRQSGLPLYLPVGGAMGVGASSGRAVRLRIKRLIDIVLSLLALVLLAPLFVIVGVMIKVTSAGPVIFGQTRDGLGGEPFSIYKFRTMDEAAGDRTGIAQTVSDDPRVTRLGRILRRTSIDELPQLWNVLRGEMSLVGPRPHVPDMQAGGGLYRELVPYYTSRLSMRPGLTGWAQVNGLRGATTDDALARSRIDHDIAYVQNFTVWLDIKIIGLTLAREFLRGTGR